MCDVSYLLLFVYILTSNGDDTRVMEAKWESKRGRKERKYDNMKEVCLDSCTRSISTSETGILDDIHQTDNFGKNYVSKC